MITVIGIVDDPRFVDDQRGEVAKLVFGAFLEDDFVTFNGLLADECIGGLTLAEVEQVFDVSRDFYRRLMLPIDLADTQIRVTNMVGTELRSDVTLEWSTVLGRLDPFTSLVELGLVWEGDSWKEDRFCKEIVAFAEFTDPSDG